MTTMRAVIARRLMLGEIFIIKPIISILNNKSELFLSAFLALGDEP